MTILNWAFGRFEVTPLQEESKDLSDVDIRLTVMGARGDVKRRARKLAETLAATLS